VWRLSRNLQVRFVKPVFVLLQKAEINRLAKSKKGKPKFTKVFSSIDTDGSGEIDLQELLNGLTNMG
jgi:Ca2+-binding EF-hand superfamily protein